MGNTEFIHAHAHFFYSEGRSCPEVTLPIAELIVLIYRYGNREAPGVLTAWESYLEWCKMRGGGQGIRVGDSIFDNEIGLLDCQKEFLGLCKWLNLKRRRENNYCKKDFSLKGLYCMYVLYCINREVQFRMSRSFVVCWKTVSVIK